MPFGLSFQDSGKNTGKRTNTPKSSFDPDLIGSSCFLLPTSQPSEDARLARWQRIVPREELLMQKNSRSAFESVRCKM